VVVIGVGVLSARLLIVSCSAAKKPDEGLLPAIDRYDGVNFQVIRKARRERYWNLDTHLFILSAKYGLISEHILIPYYDFRMTLARAQELQGTVAAQLDRISRQVSFSEVFINAGKVYRIALETSVELPLHQPTYAVGGIGQKMAQMKQWIATTT